MQHKIQFWVCTNVFLQQQLTSWDSTSSIKAQQWIKEVRQGMNFYSHKSNLEVCTNMFNLLTENAPVHNIGSSPRRLKKEHIFTQHKIQSWLCTNMFIQRQLASWEHTSSQQWVKEVKKKRIFTQHTIQSWVCTNMLTQRQITRWECTAQQVGKGGKEGVNFHSSRKIKSWVWTNMFLQR